MTFEAIGETDATRVLLEIGGEDRESFLQGLVTSDVKKVREGLVYAAFLTPQGKYLADFFLSPRAGAILLDVAASLADDLERRLSMYRLRAKVTLARAALVVRRGLGAPPAGAFTDPRHPSLGWRRYDSAESAPIGAATAEGPGIDWVALRVAACIPESGIELIPNETYILEAGFDRLAGVDFRKGCYVGQEVTARMHHKTELRKGFRTVGIEGVAQPGTAILSGEKQIGTLYSRSENQAIAYLRFDQAEGELRAGSARVTL